MCSVWFRQALVCQALVVIQVRWQWVWVIIYSSGWRAMQVQKQPLFKHSIINYQNVTNQLKINVPGKPSMLYVYDDHMQVRFEGRVADVHYYKDLLYLTGMEHRDLVAIIHYKKLDRATVSARMPYCDLAIKIRDYVRQQIELLTDKPDQTTNLNYRRDLLRKLKLRYKQIYGPIYDAGEKMLNPEWLDSFLFQDYEEVKEFNQLARQNAYQLQRKLILTKIKNTIDHGKKKQEPGIPEQFTPRNLDIVKCDEGVRYYDDSKKLKLVLKEDDKQDDLIGEALPDVIRPEIFDNFDKLEIRGEPMQIESEGGKLVTLQSDRTHEPSIKLARTEKDKYKLSQHKELQIKRANKGRDDRPKEELRFDEDQATKARAWMKIFYQIQHHSMVTVAHLDLITAELNKLLYSEPKLPIYLEQAITKTQHNLLAFKRAKSADFQ